MGIEVPLRVKTVCYSETPMHTVWKNDVAELYVRENYPPSDAEILHELFHVRQFKAGFPGIYAPPNYLEIGILAQTLILDQYVARDMLRYGFKEEVLELVELHTRDFLIQFDRYGAPSHRYGTATTLLCSLNWCTQVIRSSPSLYARYRTIKERALATLPPAAGRVFHTLLPWLTSFPLSDNASDLVGYYSRVLHSIGAKFSTVNNLAVVILSWATRNLEGD